MSGPKGHTEHDVIVVGSGAGGSTVAREMTLRGHSVLLLERGGRVRRMGNTLTAARAMRRFGLTRSQEKHTVTFANNFGGLSLLSAGCAAPPPPQVFDPVGVDLRQEVEEARTEMHIQQLPDRLIGEANLRLLSAAHDAGQSWERIDNFIDPDRCVEGCASCMLGCRTGAKFTARVYGDEAVAKGAQLQLRTTVEEVIVEQGKAVGVRGRCRGRRVEHFGKRIVLSAGVDNSYMLRRAGIAEAGQGFCCDWLQFVGGVVPGISTSRANPMTVGTLEHYDTDGLVLLPVFPNWAMFGALLWLTGMRHLLKLPRYWRYSGIMVKIRDETTGELHRGTRFSKPLTDLDRKKLDKGVGMIRRILVQAGAKEASIVALKPSGAHPSATCRIGEVVDSTLETRIPNLYCCDASVFPTSLGLPVVWTVVSLGKRLAKHLDRTLQS